MQFEVPPKVSVCVVTYNQEKYIRQCLQSIVDQEANFNFEIIIGDDCSKDGTREAIEHFKEKYPNLIKPIFQEKNIGAFKNYQSVHGHAGGDYICHVDGDDWMRPGKLQAQANYLDDNLWCPLVAHRMGIWQGERQINLTKVNPERIDIDYLLRHHPAFLHSSIMYRKSQLIDIKNFTKKFLDFHVYISAALVGNLGFINQVFGDYRSGIGISSKRDLMPQIQDAISYAATSIGNTASVQRSRSRAYLSYGIAELLAGNEMDFRDYLKRSLSSDKKWILPKIIKIGATFPGALKILIGIYKNRRKHDEEN